ncbi:MAG TPA: ABC transporter substrate-binding protein [Methylomirabilota bacterium]
MRRDAAWRLAVLGLALLTAAAVTPVPAASPETRIPWIGFLANEATPDSAPVLRDTLRARGWVEGESVKIWYRYAQGKPDFYSQHADDLVRLNVNAIVAVGPEAIDAARNATKTIPIVMVSLDDPSELVGEGAGPAANLTGITTFAPDAPARRLDLLRQVVPRLARAALLWSSDSAGASAELRATEAAAAARGVQLAKVEVTSEMDVREALRQIEKLRTQGLIVLADAVTLAHRQRLATFASRNKLPAVFPSRDFADAGGLLAYGANWTDVFRQVGALVDQILRGARPADLGIRRAARFELVVNLRAARAMPVTVPMSLLQRADRVIE